jgi:acyl dehydratase
MPNSINFDSIEIGYEIPALVKHVNLEQVLRWTAATDTYYEIHYDKDFALSHGLPGIVIHGGFLWASIGQMLTSWTGDQGMVRNLNGNFRGLHVVNEDITCKGKVTKKYVKGSLRYIECEVWVENARGEKTVPGTAVITLQS